MQSDLRNAHAKNETAFTPFTRYVSIIPRSGTPYIKNIEFVLGLPSEGYWIEIGHMAADTYTAIPSELLHLT